MSLDVPRAHLCTMTDTFIGKVGGCSDSPDRSLGYGEGVCADAPGRAAPYFQAGMISGCSHVAGGLGSEQAAFGQCRCMRQSMMKAGCFQGCPLALSALPS